MDDYDLTQDEQLKIKRYYMALQKLAKEDVRFMSNLNIFSKWLRTGTPEKALWWITQIEKQAECGLDTIGAQLVVRVVADTLD